MLERMETVVVTGAGGQLGRDLVKAFEANGYQVIGFDRQALDVSDQAEVQTRIAYIQPHIVINSAAYTKVDQAEIEIDQAFRINAIGARNVAMAAEACGAKHVYVSTDYVFPGDKMQPRDEFADTAPINVYGRSKLAGERFAVEYSKRNFVIRTSWLFGLKGINFVKAMLKLADEQDSLSVVHDQVGSPTFTVDLAECMTRLVATEQYGTYHVSNAGRCSWYEFAVKIMELAGKSISLQAVNPDHFARPAARPSYSVLDHMALRLNGFPPMRHWEEALADFMTQWKQETEAAPCSQRK